jgi:hypothetical protein
MAHGTTFVIDGFYQVQSWQQEDFRDIKRRKIVEIANDGDSGNGFELESGPSESSSEDHEEIPELSDFSSQDIFFLKRLDHYSTFCPQFCDANSCNLSKWTLHNP